MNYVRCKCGKKKGWGQFMPCDGCEECNTTMSSNPNFHETPEPHQFVTRYDTRTGKPYEICIRCLTKKAK